MMVLARRVTRIEKWLSPAANTEYLRWLRVRLEAARSRMAKCGYPFEDSKSNREDTRGWTLSEGLQRGRQMAFEAR